MPDDQLPRIGGYEILDKIGEGGMGAVYRARQLSLNRIVAVKVLTPQLSADEKFVDSFLREARAAARLSHPNLIPVFDAAVAESLLFYFAMELVDGETMLDWVLRAGPITERTALDVALSAASALKYAWDKERLIHRDIKPENIMLDRDGTVKLCDLGLAKTFGENTLMTQSGLTLGTAHYVSPEQANGDAELDLRSDIYSLGMTLYHLLTGQMPFPAASAPAVMAKHLTEQLPDPRTTGVDVSEGMCRLLEKMMAKSAAERYQSWEEVIADIHRVSRGQLPEAKLPHTGKSSLKRDPQYAVRAAAAAAAAVSHKPETEDAPPSPEKQRRLWPIVAALIAVLVLAGSAYSAWKYFSAPKKQDKPKQVEQPKPPPVDREKLAGEQFAQAQEFAAANPGQIDEILKRLRKARDDFKDTKTAATIQEQIEHWKKQQQFVQAPKQALHEAQEFAKKNPDAYDQIAERLKKIETDFPNTPESQQAQQLLTDLIARRHQAEAEAEKKRQEEEAARLAEQKRIEEERKRAEEERQAAARQPAPEETDKAFGEFCKSFLAAWSKRDFDGALAVAKRASANPVLAPLKEQTTRCEEVAALLAKYWKNLPNAFAELKGKSLTLQGITATVAGVNGRSLVLEKQVGGGVAEIEIPIDKLTTEELLQVMAISTAGNDQETLMSVAWFAFASGKGNQASVFLESAEKAGVNTQRTRDLMALLTQALLEDEARKSLSQVLTLAESNRIAEARPKAKTLLTNYAQTKIVRAAQDKLMAIAQESVKGTLYAICDDKFELLINDKPVMKGDNWQHAVKEEVTLKHGDVIKVKAINTGGAKCFAFIFTSERGDVEFSSRIADWHYYRPANEEQWWVLPNTNINALPVANKGDNSSRGKLENVSGLKCDEMVWGELDKNTVYLIKIVNARELAPQK